MNKEIKNINKNKNLDINLNSNVNVKTNINNNNEKNNEKNNENKNNNKTNISTSNNSISNIVNKNNKESIPNKTTDESTSLQPPENKDEVFDTLKSYYKSTKNKILVIHSMLDNTPILIKILNIVIPFSISYIFTNIQYNIYVSIIFAIITLFAILFMTKSIFFTILYLIFYIWLISTAALNINKTIGIPLKETDIEKNGEPFNCLGNYKIINANRLLPSDSSGSFSYSYWININTIKKNEKNNDNWFDYRKNDWKLIFYRGTEMSSDITNISTQYPGFWLTPKLNNLVIVFQNNGNPIERIEMINIPLNTWVNIATVVERKSVSVYINGLLDRTLNLEQSTPDITKNNIYVGEKNIINKNIGFPGSLAQLTYFNYPLTPDLIYKGYTYNKKIIDNYEDKIKNNYITSQLITNSDYLSTKDS